MEPASLPRPPLLPKDNAPRRYTDAPTHVHRSGYVWEWCPTHPKATYGVYLQHRLVLECHLGRFLTSQERVHHANGCPWDNRIENLTLYGGQSEHMADHWKTKGRRDRGTIEHVRAAASDSTIPASSLGLSPTTIALICKENGIAWVRRGRRPAHLLTEAMVREALQGRTALQAATLLRCHPMTLYNRFGHLLNKRPSPNALDPHKAEVLRLLYKERRPRVEVAAQYGVSESCVHKSVQRWRGQDATPDAPVPRRPRRRTSQTL